MRRVYAKCQNCETELTYCPELKHNRDDRPILRCRLCEDYLVLANTDNFGQQPFGDECRCQSHWERTGTHVEDCPLFKR